MDFHRMLDYCRQLERNNTREWFHANHDFYEAAKADYLALLDRARFAVSASAPALSDTLLSMNPKSWMYRIPRDARINRGLPPYQPSFRANLCADRKSWMPIGYFLCIEPGDASCFGTGFFPWERESLDRFRRNLAARPEELLSLIDASGTKPEGDSLKGMPRGYAADHPAADLLRYKNVFFAVTFPDRELRDFEDFAVKLTALTARLEPLRLFLLNAATADGAAPPELPPAPLYEADF